MREQEREGDEESQGTYHIDSTDGSLSYTCLIVTIGEAQLANSVCRLPFVVYRCRPWYTHGTRLRALQYRLRCQGICGLSVCITAVSMVDHGTAQHSCNVEKLKYLRRQI